ncbi:MAG: hypothetical protein ACRC1H_16205, partial [Caldilineaceae bacterium]
MAAEPRTPDTNDHATSASAIGPAAHSAAPEQRGMAGLGALAPPFVALVFLVLVGFSLVFMRLAGPILN